MIDVAIDPGGIGKIDIPAASVSSVSSEVSIAFWAYGGPTIPVANGMVSATNSNGRALNVNLPWTNSSIYWDAGNDADGYDRISKAASPIQMGRFETEILTQTKNLEVLLDLSGEWVDRIDRLRYLGST